MFSAILFNKKRIQKCLLEINDVYKIISTLMVRRIVFNFDLLSLFYETTFFRLDNIESSNQNTKKENDHASNEVIESEIPVRKKKKTIPRALDGTFFEIISENDEKVEAKCKVCFEVKRNRKFYKPL